MEIYHNFTESYKSIISVQLKNAVSKYMFLLGGNIMPGTEKLWGELLFPEEKMVVFSTEGRKTIFSEGNKCSSQSFFDPGIMFSAWRIHFLGVSSSDLP